METPYSIGSECEASDRECKYPSGPRNLCKVDLLKKNSSIFIIYSVRVFVFNLISISRSVSQRFDCHGQNFSFLCSLWIDIFLILSDIPRFQSGNLCICLMSSRGRSHYKLHLISKAAVYLEGKGTLPCFAPVFGSVDWNSWDVHYCLSFLFGAVVKCRWLIGAFPLAQETYHEQMFWYYK